MSAPLEAQPRRAWFSSLDAVAGSTNGNCILRLHAVRARVGLSRTSIWRAVRRGDFPAPRRLGLNSIGWVESEVASWIASRTSTRAGVGTG